MKLFLVLLLIAAMIATVVALIRGIVAFLQSSAEDVKSGNGPSASSLKSNKMMQQRILFQGIAIAIVALLLLMASQG
ncbi:twin transmembrane helix small protein [Sphingomonas sp.]|uniref:twin transmembrane helix small protein n=1 Tax=Sphingomonas sp. TaxID=28214 RepID=UPI001EBFA998|nr:twin transmembrane helix small protein [Sphingomonas sp.]MBX3594940.1 twin transmembrane helix small protein [Sphingomonas sp.]